MASLTCLSSFGMTGDDNGDETPSGCEVDFILGDHTAVEVKAKESVSPQDLKPLRALAEEKRLKRHLCVSLEPRPRKVGDATVLPYRTFLTALWSGEYR